jgi:hypothetical protein
VQVVAGLFRLALPVVEQVLLKAHWELMLEIYFQLLSEKAAAV